MCFFFCSKTCTSAAGVYTTKNYNDCTYEAELFKHTLLLMFRTCNLYAKFNEEINANYLFLFDNFIIFLERLLRNALFRDLSEKNAQV